MSKTDKDDVLRGVYFYALLFVIMGVAQLLLNFFGVSCTLMLYLTKNLLKVIVSFCFIRLQKMRLKIEY